MSNVHYKTAMRSWFSLFRSVYFSLSWFVELAADGTLNAIVLFFVVVVFSHPGRCSDLLHQVKQHHSLLFFGEITHGESRD